MRFVLHYRGPLRSNSDALHKQQIRDALSGQLERLWLQPPLTDDPTFLQPRQPNQYCFLREVAGIQFVPLAIAEANVTAELRIVMLRPGPPGDILSQGGDIDNRLKTLFDSLTLPQANQVKATKPDVSRRIYCLLEDDRLVTHVEVRAEQLLEDIDPSWVDLTIAVRTRVTRQTMGNYAFA